MRTPRNGLGKSFGSLARAWEARLHRSTRGPRDPTQYRADPHSDPHGPAHATGWRSSESFPNISFESKVNSSSRDLAIP